MHRGISDMWCLRKALGSSRRVWLLAPFALLSLRAANASNSTTPDDPNGKCNGNADPSYCGTTPDFPPTCTSTDRGTASLVARFCPVMCNTCTTAPTSPSTATTRTTTTSTASTTRTAAPTTAPPLCPYNGSAVRSNASAASNNGTASSFLAFGPLTASYCTRSSQCSADARCGNRTTCREGACVALPLSLQCAADLLFCNASAQCANTTSCLAANHTRCYNALCMTNASAQNVCDADCVAAHGAGATCASPDRTLNHETAVGVSACSSAEEAAGGFNLFILLWVGIAIVILAAESFALYWFCCRAKKASKVQPVGWFGALAADPALLQDAGADTPVAAPAIVTRPLSPEGGELKAGAPLEWEVFVSQNIPGGRDDRHAGIDDPLREPRVPLSTSSAKAKPADVGGGDVPCDGDTKRPFEVTAVGGFEVPDPDAWQRPQQPSPRPGNKSTTSVSCT